MNTNEQQLLSQIVVALRRIADALEKPERKVYITLEEARKLKLANDERTQK